jgi:3-hydroxymyristoyl/3-hydroxydecanoyl-(acyl carrier protein) dehydratase
MRTLREEIIACAEGRVQTLEAHQGCELTFRPGDDFTGFRGHFAGHPVLPAFVQLLMAECAVRLHSGAPLSLRRVERGKFLRPIGPNEPVTVCWQEQPQDECLRCSFTLRVGSEKAAVFALEFAAEEDQHA